MKAVGTITFTYPKHDARAEDPVKMVCSGCFLEFLVTEMEAHAVTAHKASIIRVEHRRALPKE